jgi:hypothetical protein
MRSFWLRRRSVRRQSSMMNLSPDDRATLIREMTTDVAQAVDDAIGFIGVKPEPDAGSN